MTITRICPYCKGEGKTVVVVPHPFIKDRFKTVIKWCVCMKAKFVAESPENTILSNLEGDIVLKINKELVFIPDDLGHSPNLLIKGDYNTFCNHLRSVIIKYRYADPSSSIYCCNSIDILQRFYVAQSDKTCPGLSETEKYDLLVICLGALEKNDQLNTCVAEVTYARKKKRKPVWIFMPYQTLELCKYEKSPELEELLKEYEPVVIVDEKIKVNRDTKVNNNASNFNGV
jgi:hypothetical protein